MLRRFCATLTFFVAVVGTFGDAKADLFDFSYTIAPGSVISGELTGTVQPDMDTVFVTSVSNTELNGIAGPPLPYVDSFTEVFFHIPGYPPLVSFSGLNMDLAVGTDPGYTDGFALYTDPFGVFGTPVIFAGASYGGPVETIYSPAGWSLRAVPEPSSLALLGSGLVTGVALLRRRGRSANILVA